MIYNAEVTAVACGVDAARCCNSANDGECGASDGEARPLLLASSRKRFTSPRSSIAFSRSSSALAASYCASIRRKCVFASD